MCSKNMPLDMTPATPLSKLFSVFGCVVTLLAFPNFKVEVSHARTEKAYISRSLPHSTFFRS